MKLSIFRCQTNFLDSYSDSSMHQFRYFFDLLNHSMSKFLVFHRHLLGKMKSTHRGKKPASFQFSPPSKRSLINEVRDPQKELCAILHDVVKSVSDLRLGITQIQKARKNEVNISTTRHLQMGNVNRHNQTLLSQYQSASKRRLVCLWEIHYFMRWTPDVSWLTTSRL